MAEQIYTTNEIVKETGISRQRLYAAAVFVSAKRDDPLSIKLDRNLSDLVKTNVYDKEDAENFIRWAQMRSGLISMGEHPYHNKTPLRPHNWRELAEEAKARITTCPECGGTAVRNHPRNPTKVYCLKEKIVHLVG